MERRRGGGGKRKRDLNSKMQKYSTTVWKRVGRVGGLAFTFPPFLLLAAGIGIDKVPMNQANVTHQPPPLSKAGKAQTFPVHYYMEKNPLNTA